MEIQVRDWARVTEDYLTTRGNRFKNDEWVLERKPVEVILVERSAACVRVEGEDDEAELRAPVPIACLEWLWRPLYVVGDTVRLARNIDARGGWSPHQHFLTKGRLCRIAEVLAPRHGDGYYAVVPDDQTFVDTDGVSHPIDRPYVFWLRETSLTRDGEVVDEEDQEDQKDEA